MNKFSIIGKKVLSVFMIMVLLSGTIGVCASSNIFSSDAYATETEESQTFTEGFYTYTVENSKATITKVDKSISGDIVIPSTLGGHPVTNIGDLAFNQCYTLTSIEIPNSVTNIGHSVFQLCYSLVKITVVSENTAYSSDKNGVLFNKDKTELIQYPIGNTRTNYVIPNNITSIGQIAFQFCKNITSIEISDSVTSIGDGAFQFCRNLTSIEIPNSITSIGNGAFEICEKLTDIHYSGTENEWKNIVIEDNNETLLNATIHYKKEETINGTCGDNLTWTYDESTGTLTISGTGAMWNLETYYSSPWYDFSDSILAVDIKSGVTSIGDYAFAHCQKLKNITIPDSVINIGYMAFYNCDNLINITVSSDNPKYSSDEYGVLFNKEKTILIQYPAGNIETNYIIPDSVKSIHDLAFFYCINLTNITIPDSVISIGSGAFICCKNLISIDIPVSVTNIGENAFESCNSLTSITVDSANTMYSNDKHGVLFNKDKTALIRFPAYNTKNNYTIPDSVTSIDSYAFSFCFRLESVVVGNSITRIGDHAFYICENLTDVYYSGTEREWENIFIDNYNEYLLNTTIHFVPEGIINGSCGDNLTWMFDMIEGTLTISGTGEMLNWISPSTNPTPWHHFNDCIVSVDIKSGVTSIGYSSFWNCKNLTNVSISNSVTNIGDGAFSGCCNLTNITIPYSITYIGFHAFDSCDNLTNITISNSVTQIGNDAFSGCKNLTDVYYTGTKEDWDKIMIHVGNDELLNSTIHFKKIYSSENNNVVLEYNDDCFDSEVEPKIIQKELSSKDINFLIAKGSYPKLKYDISMLSADGLYQQPINGSVKIKIKIPEELKNTDTIQIRHFPKDGADNETFSVKKGNLSIENGYIVFEVSHFSYFYICVETETPTIKICNNPGTATINYGDMLWLTAEATNLPEGAQVWWFFDSGFGASGNSIGTTVYRDSVVTVKILDSEGNVLKDADGNEITDTQNIVCKSNIWLRIISFFKNLFRIERTIIQNL